MWHFTIAIAFITSLLAVFWPAHRDARNRSFQRALPSVTLSPRVESGSTYVKHSLATLQAVQDAQGPIPDVTVRLSYRTSFHGASCDPSKHVLIIHGTGFVQDVYYWTKDSLRAAGEDRMANAFSDEAKEVSIVDRFHAENGFCVTTFDLRGHGQSEVTPGPYTVKLLAADVAAALKQIHGNKVRVHAVGFSIGFGVSLSLAFNFPDIISSVSGGGMLADTKQAQDHAMTPWLFSRPYIISTFGLELLGSAAHFAIQCNPKGMLTGVWQYISIDGYAFGSASWLHHNESSKLTSMKSPVLWMHPIKDSLCGMPEDLIQKEFAQVPHEGKKLLVLNKTGDEDHCHSLFAPTSYWPEVIVFIKTQSER